jgi:hypothetical protein
MTEEIKPCHFCKNERIEVAEIDSTVETESGTDTLALYWLTCARCHSSLHRGAATREEAVKQWNESPLRTGASGR